MKKLLIIACLWNVSVLFAQENQSNPNKLRMGVVVDPVSSWFSTKEGSIERDGARPGINGGLVIETYFAPNYGFVTGLTLTSIGGNLMYTDSVYLNTEENNKVKIDEGTTVSYMLSYISFPVGLKLKSNEIGFLTYFAQIGFMPQINIGSRAKGTEGQLNKVNVPEEINLFALSYYFGGGIEYNIGGNTSLMAGLFFNNGFTDVLSNADQKAALNFLTLRIGILF